MKRMLTKDMRVEWTVLKWTLLWTPGRVKLEWFIELNFKQRG